MNQEKKKKKDSGSQVAWAEQIVVFFIWGIYLLSMDLFLFLFSSVRLLTPSLTLRSCNLYFLPADSLLCSEIYTPL